MEGDGEDEEDEECATVIIKHLLFQFDTRVQLFIGL